MQQCRKARSRIPVSERCEEPGDLGADPDDEQRGMHPHYREEALAPYCRRPVQGFEVSMLVLHILSRGCNMRGYPIKI